MCYFSFNFKMDPIRKIKKHHVRVFIMSFNKLAALINFEQN